MEKRNPLTGLYFGHAYFAEVEEFLQATDEKEYCLMAMDIEHFRLYHQIHGQEESNRLLLIVADMLRAYEKEHGGIAGYLGGDNFAIVTVYDKDSLKELRHKIREEIRNRNKTTGYPPAYGIYAIHDKSESASTMYNRAMVALSYVIGNYTSRCCEYISEMDGKAEEEIRLLTEIQEGLENDEFTFYIQPQVDITQSKIVGGESLVRWIHGEKGMVSPGIFIPVLEENGFIADLDQVVWDKVCKWLRSCIDRGYKPVPVSINVSRIDVFSIDVPKYLISLIKKYDISPDLLKVEITESAYAEDGAVIIETAHALREFGFLVMMDDFGTGYSSLNMLSSVPVDVLKMDMRFLEINENDEEKGVGILESVINMARQMRIPIVVEGVETTAQETLLKKMGCCYTQGFYYYKPMSIEAFEELLSDENNLDHNGFWYRQAESIHLREFLDTNLFNDTVINNILGPAVFYEMVDNHIEITRVNNQYFQLAGIPVQEEKGYRKRFWNSVRDDDRQLLYAIFAEAYEKQTEGASGFINFIRRDGVVLWVNIRVYFLREKEGRRLFYASLTDMTNMKADTVIPTSIVYDLEDLTENQRRHMEKYYGNIPSPFSVIKPVLDENGNIVDYEINYANKELSRMCGGDTGRLKYLIDKFVEGKASVFLDALYKAAYSDESSEVHVYSTLSNQYFDVDLYQYQSGYACCMLQEVTSSHIHERISRNIMTTFREVHFLNLQDNYCRMIYPEADDILTRGDYEEIVSRQFDTGKIRPYDEEGVREFLALENLKKALLKKDSVEYKYKRAVEPAGEEWCMTTVTVSERQPDGIPKTAIVTIRSIESLMREKESGKRIKMAKMLETMSDGFLVYLADGDEEILYANPPVLHMFGCRTNEEFKELTSNTFTGFVHPEDIKRVEWEINSQIEETDRNMDYIRYRIVRKDGEIRWVDDIGHLEASEYMDGPRMFYVFVSDITDTITEAEKNVLIAASKRFEE